MREFKVGVWEGAGLVKAVGPLTIDGMRELRAHKLRLALRHDVHRVLMDLSTAVLLLDESEWQQLEDEKTSRHAVGVPAGYLVTGAAIEPTRRLCTKLNRAGRIALAFMTSPAAYAWLGCAPESMRLARPEEAALG